MQRGSLVQVVPGSAMMVPLVVQSVVNAVEEATVVLPVSGVTVPVVVIKAKMVARVFLVVHLDPNAAKAEDAVNQGTIVLLSMVKGDAARTVKFVPAEAAMTMNVSTPDMNPALERISAAPPDTLAIAIVQTTLNAASAPQIL